jgi:hypothetical protein
MAPGPDENRAVSIEGGSGPEPGEIIIRSPFLVKAKSVSLPDGLLAESVSRPLAWCRLGAERPNL